MNRFVNDVEYMEEDGVKMLYFNGIILLYVIIVVVDFGNKSFIIVSWVKLKFFVNYILVIIFLWKN